MANERGENDDGIRRFLDAVRARDTGRAADAASALPTRFAVGPITDMLAGLRWLAREQPDSAELTLRVSEYCYASGDIASYRSQLERARAIALRHDAEPAVLLDIDIERAFAAARFDRHLDADELERLRDLAMEHGGAARFIRIDETEVVGLGQSADLNLVQIGCRRAADVAHDWLQLGDPERAAAAARGVGCGPMAHLGWYNEALELFDLVPAEQLTPLAQASARVHSGRTMALLGLRDRFDARPTMPNLPDWVLAFDAWSAMILAGLDGDPVGVHQHHEEALRRFDSVAVTSNGALLECEAVIALVRAGEPEHALQQLERAKGRAAETPAEFELARLLATVAAFPDRAGEVEADLAIVELPTARRWPVLLACAQASGHAATRERAVAEAVAAGHETLLRRLTERADAAPNTIRVRLLGGAAIHVAGTAHDLGPGRTQALISRLALDRRKWNREELAEHLDSVGDARRAVRNTAHAIRKQLGDGALFTGGATTLALADSVTTDVDAFESASGAERLRLYGGPLLPLRLYDDWLEPRRVHLDRLFGETLVEAVRDGTIDLDHAADLASSRGLRCPRSLDALGRLATERGAVSASSVIDLRLNALLH